MTKIRNLLLIALTILFSNQAFAGCEAPAKPIIPDGNVASMDELVSAQKALKEFQAGVLEYRECIGKMETEMDKEAEGAEEKSAEILNMFNASVDRETALAEEFNLAVRAFKARQPAE